MLAPPTVQVLMQYMDWDLDNEGQIVIYTGYMLDEENGRLVDFVPPDDDDPDFELVGLVSYNPDTDELEA